MKKVVSLLLAVLMAILSSGALAEKLPAVLESGEPVTLTALVPRAYNVIDYETNEFVKWAEEQTGIHMDFTTIDGEGDQVLEEFNLLLSSGTKLPDIIFGDFSKGQLIVYGDEGVILPINGLMDEYGVYSKQLIMDITGSDDLSPITAPDGNIYAMPTGEDCYHAKYSQKMWINQAWLDNLGLQVPTTTDEFYGVLVAFRDLDPNVNGKKDEVAFSGCNDWWHSKPQNFILNSFVYYDDDAGLAVWDGVVSAEFMKSEFREGLRYLYKLCSEGLLDTEAFTQQPEQLRQLVENGADIQLGACATGTPAAFAEDVGEATKSYVTIKPLTGPDGFVTTAYYPSELLQNGVITKDCENPEAAFQWMDFLLSEDATLRQVFGVKGVDWTDPDPGALGLGGEPALLKEIVVLPGLMEQNEGVEILIGMNKRIFDGRQIDNDDPWYIEKRLADETRDNYDIGVAPGEVLTSFYMTLGDARRFEELKGNLKTHLDASIAQFTVGARDIETEWDAFLNEMRELGVDEFVALNQKYYDALKD